MWMAKHYVYYFRSSFLLMLAVVLNMCIFYHSISSYMIFQLLVYRENRMILINYKCRTVTVDKYWSLHSSNTSRLFSSRIFLRTPGAWLSQHSNAQTISRSSCSVQSKFVSSEATTYHIFLSALEDTGYRNKCYYMGCQRLLENLCSYCAVLDATMR